MKGGLAKRAPVALLKVEEARALLAECRRVDEAKAIRDKAQAIAVYLRQQKAGAEAASDAQTIVLYASGRCGELLKEQRTSGERHSGRGNNRPELESRPSTPTLADLGITKDQSSAWQRVAEIPEERVERYVEAAKERGDPISVSRLLSYTSTHVSQNTGQPEWYTPPEYISAARAVLGEIDLDPASSDAAQNTVKASRYFTAKDDGLGQKWAGRIWLNPPYSAGLVDRFVSKLCGNLESGDVSAAILLVNNATDTEWFQLAAQNAKTLCFVKGRIRFMDERGDPRGAPLQGQALLYFGEDPSLFAERFAAFGFCVRP